MDVQVKMKKIKIGYELETGKEVNINLAHTVITGLTHESGKTTCIMGLIKRSGFKAIIFKTKIGEKAITEGAIIPPFYREDFDWEYASELLEASRKEKLKFERSWIIKYSKNANNLLGFKKNIDVALAEGKLRELDKSVLISLQAYLEKILPELQFAPLSKTLDIKEGINIMDLERFKEETQGLIIRSVLNEVLNKEKNTLIVLPECWKYLPERLSTPVKRPAEAFIRQGATNNNYLIIDSQDITGVSKVILKQVSIWIMGYQREINEIKRTLDQIPLSKRQKPNPEDIATLKLGQFYLATSDFTKKIYAQPTWLNDEIAISIARGEKKIDEIEQPVTIAPYQIITKEKESKETIPTSYNQDFNKKINELREDIISNKNNFFSKFQEINETISGIYKELFDLKQNKNNINEDEIIMRVLTKIPISNNNNIDKELIIKEVLSKIPRGQGATTYEVMPLEKIKKDFLIETKNELLTQISNLNEQQKRMLKWVEQNAKATNRRELFLNSLGKNYTTGSSYTNAGKMFLELKSLELIKEDTHARIYPCLKDRLKNRLAQYGTTEQELEQVYNHILNELITTEGKSK
jgi:hypothetical protein